MAHTMKINYLPVVTYNRLQMNYDTVTVADEKTSAPASSEEPDVPADVNFQPAQDEETVKSLFADVRARIAASEKDAVPPNGDTSSVHEGRALPTGLCGEFGAFLDNAGCKTDIYTVEAGVKVTDFLMLNSHLADGDAVLSRHLLHLKEGASLTVIMDYHTPRVSSGLLGIETRVLLEKNAHLTIVKAQMLGEEFLHLDDLGGALFENAHLELLRIDLGAAHVTNGAHVNLLGKSSSFHADGAYLCRGNRKYDMNYVATQRGEKTDAKMIFRGVLQDHGEKTFRGTLDFKKGAKGAVGEEQEDTLILSEDAVNRAIPVILCQEEDVEGHHGATIGELSEDILYYFASRGIGAEEAKRIMVRARLLTVARRIPEPHLKGHVEDFLRKQL